MYVKVLSLFIAESAKEADEDHKKVLSMQDKIISKRINKIIDDYNANRQPTQYDISFLESIMNDQGLNAEIDDETLSMLTVIYLASQFNEEKEKRAKHKQKNQPKNIIDIRQRKLLSLVNRARDITDTIISTGHFPHDLPDVSEIIEMSNAINIIHPDEMSFKEKEIINRFLFAIEKTMLNA